MNKSVFYFSLFEFIVSHSYFKLHLARIFTLVTICFLVMDNQDNLYATSGLCPHAQGSAVEVDHGSSSETQPQNKNKKH